MATIQLRATVVAECLAELRKAKVHPHFTGYLCVKRDANRMGRTNDLQPNFREFFDTFLKLQGAPHGKPYLKPFEESAPSFANLWFNENVAGSYAPSSLRPDYPFRRVISVIGSGKSATYTLVERHWELAKQYLTGHAQIDAVRLAAFLYRDYAFEIATPNAQTLITIFREEFGYMSLNQPDSFNVEFETLFTNESQADGHYDWFEEA